MKCCYHSVLPPQLRKDPTSSNILQVWTNISVSWHSSSNNRKYHLVRAMSLAIPEISFLTLPWYPQFCIEGYWRDKSSYSFQHLFRDLMSTKVTNPFLTYWHYLLPHTALATNFRSSQPTVKRVTFFNLFEIDLLRLLHTSYSHRHYQGKW